MAIEPIPVETFELLGRLDSATLSSAIEGFNLRDRLSGHAGSRIRCLFPELGITLGYAITAEVDRTSPDPVTFKAPLRQLAELVEASPKPVVLVFQDVGPRPGHAAAFGYYGAAIMQRLGVRALVCDAAVKSLEQVRRLKFQYYATGSVVSHGYPRIQRMGVPVVVDGLRVEPGDLIHGDADGILSIPRSIAPAVARAAAAMRGKEDAEVAFVQGAEFTLDAALRRMGF